MSLENILWTKEGLTDKDRKKINSVAEIGFAQGKEKIETFLSDQVNILAEQVDDMDTLFNVPIHSRVIDYKTLETNLLTTLSEFVLKFTDFAELHPLYQTKLNDLKNKTERLRRFVAGISGKQSFNKAELEVWETTKDDFLNVAADIKTTLDNGVIDERSLPSNLN